MKIVNVYNQIIELNYAELKDFFDLFDTQLLLSFQMTIPVILSNRLKEEGKANEI